LAGEWEERGGGEGGADLGYDVVEGRDIFDDLGAKVSEKTRRYDTFRVNRAR
jgi:hypothetical protein